MLWEALRLEDGGGELRGVGLDSARVSIDECTHLRL